MKLLASLTLGYLNYNKIGFWIDAHKRDKMIDARLAQARAEPWTLSPEWFTQSLLRPLITNFPVIKF